MLTPSQRRYARLRAIHEQQQVKLHVPVSTTDLRLNRNNVLAFVQDWNDQRAAGIKPEVYVDDVEGLNPHFVQRVINAQPGRTYITPLAHRQLLELEQSRRPQPAQRMNAMVAVLFFAVALVLLGSRLAAL